MSDKQQKLYVIVDQDEGVIFVNLNRDMRGASVVAALHGASGAGISADAAKAIAFAAEGDAGTEKELRQALVRYLESTGGSMPNGVKFCFAVEQMTGLVASSVRAQSYLGPGQAAGISLYD